MKLRITNNAVDNLEEILFRIHQVFSVLCKSN